MVHCGRLLSFVLSTTLLAAQDPTGELDEQRFAQLQRQLTPDPAAQWRSIPWRIDLLAAQREAAAERKPLFLWTMDGHPLGCTWNNGVIDRASIFADERMGDMLRTKFIPVALDQAYQRRQRDAEGEFYRRIAGQGPRDDFKRTTQGFYVATAAGKLLLYNNNRDTAKVRRLVREALRRFDESAASSQEVAAIETGAADARYNPEPPEGGLVVRVAAKVLGGYAPTEDRWRRVFQAALSRDNLWITRTEHEALVKGELQKTLMQRIARFHLVDNTRGEPPMWQENEVQSLDVTLKDGRLQGTVHLETPDGKRGYRAELLGHVRTEKGRVVAFDIIVSGKFHGEGRYTRGAPAGEFPFAVSFQLADGTDTADAIPPQGSRGWVEGYLR